MSKIKLIGSLVGLALLVCALVFGSTFAATRVATGQPIFGEAPVNSYEAGVKWLEALYVGAAQQFAIDRNGNATTTGSMAMGTTTTNGPVTSSAGCIATTTIGTATTLAQADLVATECYTVTPNVAADHTFTLPATSSLTDFIPNAGDRRIIDLFLASTTAATSTETIIATGAGFDIEAATSSRVTVRNSMRLEFIRQATSDITLRVTSYFDGD
jgi:hypothetical protein